jgi:molybdate transport system substrate-binding protein
MSTPLDKHAHTLRIISAGAAKGLISELQAPFCNTLPSNVGLNYACSFGAVGAMQDMFKAEISQSMADTLCGVVMVSSEVILRHLIQEGLLLASSYSPIGWVNTAMARLQGDASIQAMDSEAALKEALLAAPAIYTPDTDKSTAGIHFKKVLSSLGLWEALRARVHNYPNGALAMGHMAQDKLKGALGCTQVTEINYTQGVEVISMLPKRFELHTLYSAACATRGQTTSLAVEFVHFLCGDSPAKEARLTGGFFER